MNLKRWDMIMTLKRLRYKKADKIVTISQACVDSFARVYPELRNKVVVLETFHQRMTFLKKQRKSRDRCIF